MGFYGNVFLEASNNDNAKELIISATNKLKKISLEKFKENNNLININYHCTKADYKKYGGFFISIAKNPKAITIDDDWFFDLSDYGTGIIDRIISELPKEEVEKMKYISTLGPKGDYNCPIILKFKEME